MGKQDETITLSKDQFNEAIAAAARAGAEAALAAAKAAPAQQAHAVPTADDHFDALKRQKEIHAPPLPQSFQKNCPSPTGATFTAVIDHRGNVVRLDDYTHPAGVDVKVTEGGLVPSGFEIGREKHQQWKWENFWQADINAYVGKPLPAHIAEHAKRVTGAA